MSAWELPTSLEIGGVGYPIRTDFRAILRIMECLNAPQYEDDEKKMIFFTIFFPTYKEIPKRFYQEAFDKAVDFIDMGMRDDSKRKKPTTMDWAKDSAIIIPAVNRVMGQEVRALKYLHWWTFLGAYLEIGESLFSSVLNIRQKKAKGKKLEDYEKEFYQDNRELIDLNKTSKRSQAEVDELRKLFGLTK